MPNFIFYSWQSDLPNNTNRGLIERALEKASKAIRSDQELIVDPVIDRDTANVPGAPDIGATIFDKIDRASVFVADLSIINRNSRVRPSPNPNVLIELGYALKALGWQRVVLVANTYFGPPDKLPFDLRQKRVTTYHSAPGDSPRKDERDHLALALERAIRSILTNAPIASPNLGEATSLFLAQRDAAAATGKEATQYPDGSGHSLYTGYFELWSHPSTFRSDLFPLSKLREAARNADETFVDWPFLYFGQGVDDPYVISDGIEAAVKFILPDRHLADFWQFRRNGFFYQRTLMREETQAKMQGIDPILDFRSFAIYIALGIRCVTRLYEGLFEDSELVSISVRINGTEGRHLVHGGPVLRGRYTARVPEIHLTQVSSLAGWRAGLVEHALTFCDECFQRFNWQSPDLDACKVTIEKVLARRPLS